MGLFGKKKMDEPPPPPHEEIPPLPTLESLHEEHGMHQVQQQKIPQNPQPQQAPRYNLPQTPKPFTTMPKQQAPLPIIQKQETVQPQTIIVKEERPAFAPLFVKIDRYRNILNALGQLRTSVIMIKNSFSTLNELEKARFETLKLIEDAVGKVEGKLSALDSELLRPSGHHPETTPEYHDVQTVHATIADLKGQIDQLKTELEQMG